MLQSITLKLRGSLGMFWAALDEDERRVIVIGAAYLAFTAWSWYSMGAKKRERADLIAEIEGRIRA